MPLDARHARLVTLACCLLLILYYTLSSLWLAGHAPNLTLWLAQVLPLAALLPFLRRDIVRAYQWLCFIILAYFSGAVLAAFTPGRLAAGLLQIFLCVLLFASAIVFVRKHSPPPSM